MKCAKAVSSGTGLPNHIRTCRLLLAGELRVLLLHSEYEGTAFMRYISKLLRDCMASSINLSFSHAVLIRIVLVLDTGLLVSRCETSG
jgi:hypothetical protein